MARRPVPGQQPVQQPTKRQRSSRCVPRVRAALAPTAAGLGRGLSWPYWPQFLESPENGNREASRRGRRRPEPEYTKSSALRQYAAQTRYVHQDEWRPPRQLAATHDAEVPLLAVRRPARFDQTAEPAPVVSRAPPASAKTAQQVGAGLLATAAGFGEDAAVLMHVGMGVA